MKVSSIFGYFYWSPFIG